MCFYLYTYNSECENYNSFQLFSSYSIWILLKTRDSLASNDLESHGFVCLHFERWTVSNVVLMCICGGKNPTVMLLMSVRECPDTYSDLRLWLVYNRQFESDVLNDSDLPLFVKLWQCQKMERFDRKLLILKYIFST